MIRISQPNELSKQILNLRKHRDKQNTASVHKQTLCFNDSLHSEFQTSQHYIFN